mgnify:CR=1 FL=1
MNLGPGSYHFSDWGSSFDEHPQYAILKCHVERAVQDLFLNALRLQSQDFVYIFDTEEKIDDFCSRMISYWESEEDYEICGEIVSLKKKLKKKWFDIPPVDRGKEMVIREWLKSSF